MYYYLIDIVNIEILSLKFLLQNTKRPFKYSAHTGAVQTPLHQQQNKETPRLFYLSSPGDHKYVKHVQNSEKGILLPNDKNISLTINNTTAGCAE